MQNINRNYKDRLFIFLFGKEERKDFTLQLYNALNNTNYTNIDDLSFNTLENIIYINMKNDVSFVINNQINVYEHQSSFNPNMPLRMLLYISDLYSKELISEYNSLYSSVQLKIKEPNFIVFYNGSERKEEKIIMKLSDMYEDRKNEAKLELKVTMLNINYGKNQDILSKCKPLEEYSYFVDEIRKAHGTGANMAEAVEGAIMKLPEDSIIQPLLWANRAEVIDMILEEYNEEWEEKARQKKFNELQQEIVSLKSENEKQRSERDKERSESQNKINVLNEIIAKRDNEINKLNEIIKNLKG